MTSNTAQNQNLDADKKSTGMNRVLRYIAGYSLFLVFLVAAAFLIFRLRANLIQIAFLLGYNQVKVKGIANLGILFGGILVLAGVIFSEDYLRKGIQKKQMLQHALHIFLAEISLFAISYLLYWLLPLLLA